MPRQIVQYPIERSPLYELSSKKRLYALLHCTAFDFAYIRRHGKALYTHFPTVDRYKSDQPALTHKPRNVQSPHAILADVQKRLLKLLSRIELPDYLHSARRGRSYKTNARAHAFGSSAARVDIKKYYESTRWEYVYRYFLNVLRCGKDIAHRLTQICCLQFRLPTGSPISPLMAFLAYRPMFDELNDLAKEMGLAMSVYVDDIYVSGVGKASGFIEPAKKIIARYGLRAHKFAATAAGQPLIVTGVKIGRNGASIPSGRFRKIRALEAELRIAAKPERRAIFLKALRGQYREMGDLVPHARSVAMIYQREIEKLPEALQVKRKRRRAERKYRLPTPQFRGCPTLPVAAI